jgi:hypothetical protein
MDRVSVGMGEYLPEGWYPFGDFCRLLSRIHNDLGKGDPVHIFRMGKRTVIDDDRWRNLFQNKNPKEVFTTTRRQEAQYDVGDFIVKSVKEGHITIRASLWDCEETEAALWSEFYRGRISGILELTGRDGKVEMDTDFTEDKKCCTYEIAWK